MLNNSSLVTGAKTTSVAAWNFHKITHIPCMIILLLAVTYYAGTVPLIQSDEIPHPPGLAIRSV